MNINKIGFFVFALLIISILILILFLERPGRFFAFTLAGCIFLLIFVYKTFVTGSREKQKESENELQ